MKTLSIWLVALVTIVFAARYTYEISWSLQMAAVDLTAHRGQERAAADRDPAIRTACEQALTAWPSTTELTR